MLKFFLNGQEVPSPGDWDDFEQEFRRDFDDRSIGVTYEQTITFSGEGHKILADIYASDGYCADVDIHVTDECEGVTYTAARGKIILADARWNEAECTVEVSVADNGIGARIDNNKSIPVSPTAPRSKNGAVITPVSPIPLVMFNTATGADEGASRRAFDWFDCVKHAIAYMSDDTITVLSPWYDALPDDERYAIAYGNDLRVPGLETPRFVYAWKDLFYEVAVKYDLWFFAYEDPLGQQYLLISPGGDFYDTAVGISLQNVDGIERWIDTDRLHASVMVGSPDEIRELQTAHSLPYVSMNGHSEETFHFTGVCNTDSELDLTGAWQYGNNVIEEVVENNNDDYDKDTFIVQYDRSTNKATQGTYLNAGAAPYLYNERITNFNVLLRQDLPSSVGANYAASDDTMQATNTVDSFPTYTFPVGGVFNESTAYHAQFDNDFAPPNFDTNNNWGNGTAQGTPVSEANSRYTAVAQGFYSFNIVGNWRIITSVPSKFGGGGGTLPSCVYGTRRVAFRVRVFNSGDVQIGADQVFTTSTEWRPGDYSFLFNVGASLNVGDYLEIHYTMQSMGSINVTDDMGPPVPCADQTIGTGSVEMSLRVGSSIATDVIVGGGFIVPSGTPRLEVLEFDRNMPITQWLSTILGPQEQIMVGARATHPMTIKRNLATGETTWTLIRKP